MGTWAERRLLLLYNKHWAHCPSSPNLGNITEVIALRDDLTCGIEILQFFGAILPKHYCRTTFPSNCVVYTGTHGNDTTRGWYETPENRKKTSAAAIWPAPGDIAWDMIRLGWGSVADWLSPQCRTCSTWIAKARGPSRQTSRQLGLAHDQDTLNEFVRSRLEEMNFLYGHWKAKEGDQDKDSTNEENKRGSISLKKVDKSTLASYSELYSNLPSDSVNPNTLRESPTPLLQPGSTEVFEHRLSLG